MIDILTLNTTQLAEFCSIMIPSIWSRSFTKYALNSKRHAAFETFCHKVLKATQISCACIILALHYIQQLRTAFPSIRASIGSEVRLFTTSLLLANKYLDDNTFTNKTWSQVSNIPVNELNIMEMEFLSALKYTLHMPESQFFTWKATCQQWYHRLQSPPPPPQVEIVTSTKRSFDSMVTIEESPRKKLFSIDQLYNPNNTICKPILSWSSSVSALSSSKYHSNPYLTHH